MVKCSIGGTARGNLERNGKSRKCALVVVSTHETDVRPCSPPSSELIRVYSEVHSIARFEDEIRLWVVVHCVVDESSGNVGGGGDLFRRGSLVGGGVFFVGRYQIGGGSLIGGGCAIREGCRVGVGSLIEDGSFFGGGVCLGRGFRLGGGSFLRLRGETFLGVWVLEEVVERSLLFGGRILFGGSILFGRGILFGRSILFRWGN
jgi:hypothetical protein